MFAGGGLSPATAAAPPAEASTINQVDPATITPEMVEEAYDQLLASDLPRTVTGEGKAAQTTFKFTEGFELTFGTDYKAAKDAGNAIQPRIGGGFDGGGMYVLLNQFDQNLVIGGSGFVLGAAICAIPAVGQVACLVVGGILTIATTALAVNGGTCSNNRQFKIYVTNGLRAAGCV